MVCQSYRPLFDFIAGKIADFLAENAVSDDKGYDNIHERRATPYRLGFTFSFTCEQTSLAGGTLIRWDKGWDIPEAVGQDPCVMLQEAIDKLNLPVLVTVLANDSVGTLLTRSYTAGQNNSTLAAVIFGTGTNAAYVEKISNIKRFSTTKVPAGQIMVINTEWGCLDDKMEVLPRTFCDDRLDTESTDPGSQMFEKRISGMYLGELLRLVLVQLVQEAAFEMIINKDSPLFQRQGIDSSFLSELAVTGSSDYLQSLTLVESKLLAKNVTASDVTAIQILSAAIVRRAARLAGASLAAIIIQSGRLEPLSAQLKYPDAQITEHEASEASNTPRSSVQKLRRNLSLLWRRMIKLLSRLNMSRAKSQSAHISPRFSTAEESDPEKTIIDIGADGSLFELYPTFEANMREALQEVKEIGPSGERQVRIGLAKDGSGVGAALMAQAALEMEKRGEQ
jgi:hexokinase